MVSFAHGLRPAMVTKTLGRNIKQLVTYKHTLESLRYQYCTLFKYSFLPFYSLGDARSNDGDTHIYEVFPPLLFKVLNAVKRRYDHGSSYK